MSFPRYPAYKPSGLNWLGDVPDHWDLRRLGYYFGERREKVSDREYQPLSVTKEGIVPQLETAAKTDDGDNRKRVCRGDFVINSRSDRKGSAGLSDLDGSVSLISTVLKPKESIHGAFIHHLFRSVPFQEEFYRFGKGIVADLWSTNYTAMAGITIAMPSHGEQLAIATFLDRETAKIDTLIAEQQRLIELLQEKRQAVISHAVTKGLNPDAPLKDSGVEWLGEVPEHWDAMQLNKLTNKITNGYVGPTRDILEDDGVRYLQSLHIKNNRIIFDTPYYVSKSWSLSKEKSILREGDVLIVQTGDIGQSAVVTKEFEGCNCHALIVASPRKDRLSGAWLSWVLNSTFGRETLLSIQTGALHPHLNCGNVKYIQVPVPPTDEQAAICKYIEVGNEEFDRLISDASSSIGLMTERRSALISAAVTGQIDVRGLAPEADAA